MTSSNIHIEVKRWGNSLAVIIPAETAKELKLEEGVAVDLEIRKCERIDAFGILKSKVPFEREHEHETHW